MSKQTAMQILIDFITEQEANSMLNKDTIVAYRHGIRKGLRIALSQAKVLLDTEREQIEQSYDEAWVKGHDKSDWKSGHSYFITNYKNKNDE